MLAFSCNLTWKCDSVFLPFIIIRAPFHQRPSIVIQRQLGFRFCSNPNSDAVIATEFSKLPQLCSRGVRKKMHHRISWNESTAKWNVHIHITSKMRQWNGFLMHFLCWISNAILYLDGCAYESWLDLSRVSYWYTEYAALHPGLLLLLYFIWGRLTNYNSCMNESWYNEKVCGEITYPFPNFNGATEPFVMACCLLGARSLFIAYIHRGDCRNDWT